MLPLLVLILVVGSLPAAESLRRSAVVRAVEQARPSVVNINGQKLVPSDDAYATDATKRVNGMGTGVVVDSRGYILTNYHVVQGVRRIRVTLANGQAYIARLVAHDPGTDLAIIKIPIRDRMPVIRVGTSRHILTGETVIAMGNAFGYEHTVTTGIVSAQHRNVKVNERQSYRDLIQTDASINPGNSGGPLLNIDGDMIGINVAVRVGAQGIGFAIPVDQGMQVAARLMSIERITGLWHGMIHEDQTDGDAVQVVVRDVAPGSPAEHAGIREGDVIRQVAGRKVHRGVDLECALISTAAGDQVEFAVLRDDRPVDITLGLVPSPEKASRRPLAASVAEDACWDKLGLHTRPLVNKDAKGVFERFRGGLRVTAVKQDGLGARQGIQKGDVLVGVHIWETVTTGNLEYILNEADLTAEQSVPFYVVREGKTLSGSIDVDDLR